jgi:hypothetical protein
MLATIRLAISRNTAVVYDGDIAVYTPLNLWTSTGVRLNPMLVVKSQWH